MHALMIVFPEPGHLHPFLGVAQQLEANGHEVSFFSAEDLSGRLARAGLRAKCFSIETQSGETGQRSNRSAAYADRLRDPAWAKRWYDRAYLSPVARQVEMLRTVVHKIKPSLLCVDPAMYAGAIVAMQENIPWASIAPTLTVLSPSAFRSVYHDAMMLQNQERESLFRSFSVTVPAKFGEAISPWLNTVCATEEFVPRVEADNAFSHYAGPSSALGLRGDEPEFLWKKLNPELPLIYASFGSQVSPPAHIFEALAKAFSGEEAQMVFSLNHWADAPWVASLPPHVIAVRYAPQLALIEKASVFVTHGGANGVTESLQYGKPMLVIPIAHEQSLQAHFVEKAGIGRRLEIEEVTSAACRSAISELMENGAHRLKLDRIRCSYSQANGATAIVTLLEELDRSRKPIPAVPGPEAQ